MRKIRIDICLFDRGLFCWLLLISMLIEPDLEQASYQYEDVAQDHRNHADPRISVDGTAPVKSYESTPDKSHCYSSNDE